MSNESKNRTAETAADDVVAAAKGTAQAIAANADKGAAVGKAVPEAMTEAAQKTANKGKKPGKAATDAGVLKAVGVAVCKRHGLAEVWVTCDGQVFPIEGDAKAHAKNLPSKETLKVTAK